MSRQGGTYIKKGDGPAELVSRTTEHKDGNRPRTADGVALRDLHKRKPSKAKPKRGD